MKKNWLLALFLGCAVLASRAQTVTFGGNLDLEIRRGGVNSNPLLNQTPGPDWSLFAPNMRLFMNADLGPGWWLDAALQTDYYGQAEPHPAFFSLLNVNVQPLAGNDLTLQAGRILIPFGLDHKRFINPENPFANLGFDAAWNLRVDKKAGFVASGPLSYTAGRPGMAVVYQRRYTQGLAIAGTVGDSKWLDYTLAVTTAPAGGHSEYNQHSTPSFIGRAVVKPVLWAAAGLSATRGAYMHRAAGINDSLSASELGGYTQQALAADLTLDYAWYRFAVQYTVSDWTAPRFFTANVPAGQSGVVDYSLQTRLFQVESVINLPFAPGAWVAARYEQMRFSKEQLTAPWILQAQLIPTPEVTWMPDWNRAELVAGYKFTEKVTGKISWLAGDNTGRERGDRVFTLQLTTLF